MHEMQKGGGRKYCPDGMSGCSGAMAKFVLGTSLGWGYQSRECVLHCFLYSEAEGRVQQDPSFPRCFGTEASCPYRSLADKSCSSKSTWALENSCQLSCSYRDLHLVWDSFGSSSLCPLHGPQSALGLRLLLGDLVCSLVWSLQTGLLSSVTFTSF